MPEVTPEQWQQVKLSFDELPDPRDPRGIRHRLSNILTLSLLAVICGANDFSEIAEYAHSKEEWLSTFLDLKHGIPSEDTLSRVLSRLKPHVWHHHFQEWVKTLTLPEVDFPTVLAIDGKTARGSQKAHLQALHTVSVWSVNHGVVMAQSQVDEKSNEITCLPEMLELLDLSGSIITTDALGCQKQVAWSVMEQGGDYLLALKDNHPHLHKDVQWAFSHQDELGWDRTQTVATFDNSHGREETRTYWVLSDLSFLAHETQQSWRGLSCVVRVRRIRETAEHRSEQDSYYLSSLKTDIDTLSGCVRGHWGVENGLHWVLDTAFREDENQSRKGFTQQNLVTLRHMALNLLKLEKSVKSSIKNKRLRAGWDNTYLLKVLKS